MSVPQTANCFGFVARSGFAGVLKVPERFIYSLADINAQFNSVSRIDVSGDRCSSERSPKARHRRAATAFGIGPDTSDEATKGALLSIKKTTIGMAFPLSRGFLIGRNPNEQNALGIGETWRSAPVILMSLLGIVRTMGTMSHPSKSKQPLIKIKGKYPCSAAHFSPRPS